MRSYAHAKQKILMSVSRKFASRARTYVLYVVHSKQTRVFVVLLHLRRSVGALNHFRTSTRRFCVRLAKYVQLNYYLFDVTADLMFYLGS